MSNADVMLEALKAMQGKRKSYKEKAMKYFNENSKHIKFTVHETTTMGCFVVRAEFEHIDWNIEVVDSYCRVDHYLRNTLEQFKNNIARQYFK